MKELWESSYPFTYWDNRIQKINPYNPEDKLEAVFTLLQLADTYVTILSAKLRNTYAPWYMVIKETYKSDIDETFEIFDVETEDGQVYADLSLFDGEPGDLIGVNVNEEWRD